MKNNNGDLPASPVPNETLSELPSLCVTESMGLSKREMFAMHMMASMSSAYWDNQDSYDSGIHLVKCQAESAVEMADALLAELDK